MFFCFCFDFFGVSETHGRTCRSRSDVICAGSCGLVHINSAMDRVCRWWVFFVTYQRVACVIRAAAWIILITLALALCHCIGVLVGLRRDVGRFRITDMVASAMHNCIHL